MSFRRQGEDGDVHVANAISYANAYGLYGLNMPVCQRQTRVEDVARLKRHGLWVSLWFVQNGDTAAAYRASGADAFVTDHVSSVRQLD